MTIDLMLCSTGHAEVAYARLNRGTVCPACEALDEQKEHLTDEHSAAMDALRMDKDERIAELYRELEYLNRRVSELENP